MWKTVGLCLKNIARAKLTSSVFFDPILPTLYVTPLCNLRCTYCQDFGAHRNRDYFPQVLPLESMQRLVRIARDACEALYFTGGEPLMRSDICELLAYARAQKFMYLAMNTNGLLLPDKPDVVKYLDNLVISMDSVNEGRDDPDLPKHAKKVQQLRETIAWAASLRKTKPSFVCTVTSVVRPGRVAEARQTMEYCLSVGAEFSIQHLTVLVDGIGAVRSPELMADPEFPAFMNAMMEAKRVGKAISGSELYLRTIRDQKPFACTPTVVPHITHDGMLDYPCREIRGKVKVDLLKAGSIKAAMREGAKLYGEPPKNCSQCPDRCYVETAALIHRPTSLVRSVGGYFGQIRRKPVLALPSPVAPPSPDSIVPPSVPGPSDNVQVRDQAG